MNRLSNLRSNNRPPGCELPLGLMIGRQRQKSVELRPLEGDAQLKLLDLDPRQPRERLVSKTLALVVRRIGVLENPSSDVLHRLALADRHAIIRAWLIGSGTHELSATADCADCCRRLDLSLDLVSVQLPKVPTSGMVGLVRSDATGRIRQRLRLPDPALIEQAQDEFGLLAACLGCAREAAQPWVEAAEKALSRYDPLGHISIVGRCPDCNGHIEAEIDLAHRWLLALKRTSDALVEDIHLLASRYHWTEAEVLRLPDSRRQLYLELCGNVTVGMFDM